MAAVPYGNEFVVNTIISGTQHRPFITKLATGGFAIGWQDESGTLNAQTQDDVRFALYDAFGARVTSGDKLAYTTLENPPGSGDFNWTASQFEGNAAGFADGKFVMVWRDYSASGDDINNGAIRAQVFNSNGTLSGDIIDVNTTFPLIQSEPSVTVLTGGRFVVTWTTEDQNASGTTDIMRRVFNSDGSPVTGEQVVNLQTVGNQNNSTVFALQDGGFAVVWDDREAGPATGFQTKTFIRFYNSNGTALAAPMLANQTAAGDPQLVGLTELIDDRIVLTWTENQTAAPGDASGSSVKLRIYDPINNIFGGTITVNTTTGNDQRDAKVLALPDGQFVVAWTDHSTTGADTSFTAVRLQVFSAAGVKVGGEVLVNQQSTFEQQNPVLSVLADGRFVVAWEDNSHIGTDTDAFSVRARIYDARIAAIDIDGTAQADSYQGSVFNDTIDGLAGGDLIRGGKGSDLIFGGLGLDFLFGDKGDDELQGGGDADELDGGLGNDKLNGGSGADKMKGGDGNDIYYVDDPGDTVTELPNQGYDTVYSFLLTYTLTDNVEQLIAAGVGNFVGKGNVLDNKLVGGAGNDRFVADSGGADAFFGGSGTDSVDYRLQTVGAIIDAVTKTTGGSALGDAFSSIETFYGSDTAGDRFTAKFGAVTYIGGGGNDRLRGGTEADSLRGGAANDILRGGGGADDIQGGNGDDNMIGDAGADSFIYLEHILVGGFGNDIIADFEDGIDKIRVSQFVANGIGGANGVVISNNNSTDVLVSHALGTIHVQSAAAITLTAADFDFFPPF